MRRSSDWRAYVISPAIIFVVWTMIAGCLALVSQNKSWSAAILGFVAIALLQNYLMILHHEGTHFLIFPDPRTNDWITDVFCGFPFGERLATYRPFHFEHHRFSHDPMRDPEVPYYQAQGYHFKPRPLLALAKSFCLDLSGYSWCQFFWAFLKDKTQSKSHRQNIGELLRAGLFIAGLFLLVRDQKSMKLFFTHWLGPQATLLFFIGKLRSYAEHGYLENGERTTFRQKHHWIYRLLIAPLNADLHLEHHCKPSVPFYFLKEISKTLHDSIHICGFVIGPKSTFHRILLASSDRLNDCAPVVAASVDFPPTVSEIGPHQETFPHVLS